MTVNVFGNSCAIFKSGAFNLSEKEIFTRRFDKKSKYELIARNMLLSSSKMSLSTIGYLENDYPGLVSWADNTNVK